MTKSSIEKIKSYLLDLHDDLKLNLIDMNQTKDMFMNEPSTELLRRALNMSYYQGQKQALDWLQYNVESQDSHTLMTLIEDKLHLLTEQDSKVKNLAIMAKELPEQLSQEAHRDGKRSILKHIKTRIDVF